MVEVICLDLRVSVICFNWKIIDCWISISVLNRLSGFLRCLQLLMDVLQWDKQYSHGCDSILKWCHRCETGIHCQVGTVGLIGTDPPVVGRDAFWHRASIGIPKLTQPLRHISYTT